MAAASNQTLDTPVGFRGMIPAVDTGRDPKQDWLDRETTLGDVLFAHRTTPTVSEQEWVGLVRAIAKGDQLALHQLFTRAHRLVFTLTMRITSSRQAAEELTLDVFHDVWRKAGNYDPVGGSVVGWIMNQARSRAIDRVRFDQRKKRIKNHADDPSTLTVASGPQEAFVAREQVRILRQALQVLTPDERQAIETAYFAEMTYAETAARLDQPVGTVKTRIRSALEKLRRVLAGALKDL
jgi:RNA polymerase sigma-70 factor (ECF subfamily)